MKTVNCVTLVKTAEPFIFRPTSTKVSAVHAADIVTHERGNCHQFEVNPDHESPNLQRIGEIIRDLRLTPSDGEAFLLQECIKTAHSSAVLGGYGVGALLANVTEKEITIIQTAENERRKGSKYQYTGHAEMRLVDLSTTYLQNGVDHENDVACVNLCPCPGCFGHMVDAHFPTVLIGSIDPMTGAAFLRDRDLQLALGDPRKQVIEKRGIVYRFPEIDDAKLRELLIGLSWYTFHATRKQVHKTLHRRALTE